MTERELCGFHRGAAHSENTDRALAQSPVFFFSLSPFFFFLSFFFLSSATKRLVKPFLHESVTSLEAWTWVCEVASVPFTFPSVPFP